MIILPKEDEYSVCPISAKSEQEESSNLYVSSRTANNEEEFYPSIPGLAGKENRMPHLGKGRAGRVIGILYVACWTAEQRKGSKFL